MYMSRHHQMNDRESIFTLMESHALGAWVCTGVDGLVANHVPFYLDRSRGPWGTLVGHVSRANSVWRGLAKDVSSGTPSVVMFRGPQAYITPNWYPGKLEHGKVVPTWNYTAVNAHGVARAVEDRDWLLAMLDRLTQVHEAGQPAPWRPADAPPEYIEAMLRAIVGIEIPIDRIEAKCKASQDEDAQDRVRTVAGLHMSQHQDAKQMAQLVQAAMDAERATGISGQP